MEPVARFDEAIACGDPECLNPAGQSNWAEPEQDGDHTYYQCIVCGYTTGYQRIQTEAVAVAQDGTCSLGIPASTRRIASVGMEGALAANQPPLLQIGTRRATT